MWNIHVGLYLKMLGWVKFGKRLLYKGMGPASWKMKLKIIIFAKEYSIPALWTTLDKSLYFPEPPWILFLILDRHEIEKKLAEVIIDSSHSEIFYKGCLYLVIQFPKIIRCSLKVDQVIWWGKIKVLNRNKLGNKRQYKRLWSSLI